VTVIAAIAKDGNVIMGCDTAATYGNTFVFKGEGKIVEVTAADGERVLVGAAGNAAIMSVVKRDLSIFSTPAADASDEDADGWANATAQAITAILSECSPSLLSGGGEDASSVDGMLMLAWRGHLWLVFTHSAIRPSNGIVAIGSGQDVALGAMNAAVTFGAEPIDAVHEAVSLASTFADGCGVDERGPLLYSTT
jgi:ATP-dependent protease HslVU (ClpYQ) peptidase subunit